TGKRTGRPARSQGVQGEPDPLQPDRDVPRIDAKGDRRFQGCPRPRESAGDGAADPRPRHRRGVRPARGGCDVKVTILLADAAQAVEGKLYVLGGGWSTTGPDPAPMARAIK